MLVLTLLFWTQPEEKEELRLHLDPASTQLHDMGNWQLSGCPRIIALCIFRDVQQD